LVRASVELLSQKQILQVCVISMYVLYVYRL